MPVLIGDVFITCPKTGQQVKMRKACMDTDGHWKPCEHFSHRGSQGDQIMVACTFSGTEKAISPPDPKK